MPKCSSVKCNNDLRPISILHTLSKTYPRYTNALYWTRWKSSYLPVLLPCKRTPSAPIAKVTVPPLLCSDDIKCTIKQGWVTLAILADFSKTFDTVAYKTMLNKLNHLGFSESFLRWVTGYLTGRKQFVQIDDRASKPLDVVFSVPQGSAPVLFNLYVNKLTERLGSVNFNQCADDTTLYSSDKPTNIHVWEHCLQRALDRLSSWCSDWAWHSEHC